MTAEISRRGVIAASVTATALTSAEAAPALNPDLLPLTSRSGVFTPARGESVMQFSFDFPEPSVEVGGLRVSFRVQTFENAYAIDAAKTHVVRTGSTVRLVCEGLRGAGGQQPAAGRLTALFDVGGDGVVSWTVEAEAPVPVKSITSIVRGAPRGEVSLSAGRFIDFKDDEHIAEYPQLFGGMSTPLAIIRDKRNRIFELSARQTEVRPARFFFQPGPDGYRIELISEAPGWAKSNRFKSCVWRAGWGQSYAATAQAHFDHVERTYAVPHWETRADAPAWARQIDLVLSIHGAHWTGYVFNTYAKMLEILTWAAGEIDPRRVLVFLPAWDGRYYWNYPRYLADPALGGEAGFAALVQGAQKLGYRVAPMFGSNSANKTLPEFPAFSNAVTQHIDGDAFDLNWVDWDNDRRNEGWSPFMNLGVASWRRWLGGRISSVISKFGVDAYFLDIAGAWENNLSADMNVGTRQLVEDLRAAHPHVMPIGEMLYDAQMAYIPMSQVTRYAEYPKGVDAYCRSFQHLSRPAPGRGSTGVHEAGFGVYSPEIAADARAIPTLTLVDDTFDAHRAEMADYIARAKVRARTRA